MRGVEGDGDGADGCGGKWHAGTVAGQQLQLVLIDSQLLTSVECSCGLLDICSSNALISSSLHISCVPKSPRVDVGLGSRC